MNPRCSQMIFTSSVSKFLISLCLLSLFIGCIERPPVETELNGLNCLGDYDKDGSITSKDVSKALANFGESNSSSDVNSDGVVDNKDIDFLKAHMGKCQGAVYPTCQDADLDQNGTITVQDLLSLNAYQKDLDQNGVFNNEDVRLLQTYYGQECSSSSNTCAFQTEKIFSGSLLDYSCYSEITGGKSNDLFIDKTGKLYLATAAGLSISQDGGQTFIRKRISSGLPSNYTTNVFVDDNGVIYVSTYQGLAISKDNGNSFSTITTNEGLVSNNITSIFVSQKGNLYVATPYGLSISEDGAQSFVTRTTDNGIGSNNIKDVFVKTDQNNNDVVYLVTYGGGLSISINGGLNFTTKTTDHGLVSNYGESITVDTNNTIYIGTSGGLSISSDNAQSFQNKVFLQNDNFSKYTIKNIAVDSDGRIYAAAYSNGGDAALFISDDGGVNFISKNESDGLREYRSENVHVFNDNIYVLPYSKGGFSVSYDSGNSFSSVYDNSGITGQKINNLQIVDNLLFVANANGISALSDEGITYEKKSEFDGVSISDIFVDGQNFFVGTDQGLFISSDGGTNFIIRTTSNGLPSNSVKKVFVTSNLNIFVLSGSSIYFSNDNGLNFSKLTVIDGYQNSYIYTLFVDDQDRIYVGSPAGLSISTDYGQSFSLRTTDNGLGNNIVHTIFVDADEKIYVGHEEGGVSISSDSGVSFQNFDMNDGLVDNTVKSIHVNADGHIYIGTYGGLSISKDAGDTFISYTKEDGIESNVIWGIQIFKNTLFLATDSGLSQANLSDL